ncbi:MAG: lipid II flippase MurJ [Candidatus Eisenbacteria bacterium]
MTETKPIPDMADQRDGIPHSRGLVHEGLWIILLTSASKVLGIAREGLLAWAFGTSAIVDALRVAQSGTLLIIHLLAGSVLDSAFLPTFKHLIAQRRTRLAWRAVTLAARALAIAGGVLCLALLLGGRVWTRLLAPGFDATRLGYAALFLAAMSPAVPLMFGANLLATVSSALYRFRLPALRALVQNVVILAGTIAAVAIGARVLPGRAILPIGLALPIAQGILLIILLRSLRSHARPVARGTPDRDRLLWTLLGTALAPGFALVLTEQATVIVERVVASRLSEGSIASLDYARFLVETPLVTVGVGITQTLLPTLSDLSAAGERERFINSIRTLLLACLWALLPLSVWLLAFGEDLIRLIYAHGAFGEASVQTTTAALAGFAIGLWAWFGGTILQRAFYAQRRLRILLPLAITSLVAFAVLSFLWAPSMGVRGVSTAFSVANILFFSGSLAFLGWELARAVLPILAYLLAGGGLLYLAGSGIVPQGPPIVRLVAGAALILLAWIGWTAVNPATRRLASGLIHTLRRKT